MREQVVRLAAAALTGALLLGAPGGALAQSQGGRKGMNRELDPLVVSGDVLKPLWGKPIDRIRAYAWREGQWEPVPYQIDKVNPDGDYFIATKTIPPDIIEETGFDDVPEPEKRARRIKKFRKVEKKFKKGKLSKEEYEKARHDAYFEEVLSELDYNDEIVFMARDSGDRARRRDWLIPSGMEIEAEDPITGGKSWFYLFYFESGDVPARSEIDYIHYEPKKDFIVTRLSEIDFDDENPMLVESIVGKPPGGPIIPNVLDRFKMRIKIAFFGLFCIPMHFDENNARAFTIGYKDGPVRLIRRNIFWVVIAGIKLPFAPKLVMYFKFYENGLSSKMALDIPFSPKYFVCPGSRFTAGLDFRKNTYGAKVFTRNNKDIVIDGHLSEAEKHLTLPNQDWIAGYLPNKAALMSRLIYDPEMIRHGAVLDLYYVDDGEREDPPENEPGEHIIGYTMDIRAFPKGHYYLGFQIFTAYDFEPEQIQELLNIDDYPLRVTGRAP